MAKGEETTTQAEICKYLEARGYLFSRVNTTGVYSKKTNSFRKPSPYVKKGMADILLFHRGQTVFIECKALGGKQSKDQIKFQEEIEDEGFTYFIATSVDDVKEFGI